MKFLYVLYISLAILNCTNYGMNDSTEDEDTFKEVMRDAEKEIKSSIFLDCPIQ